VLVPGLLVLVPALSVLASGLSSLIACVSLLASLLSVHIALRPPFVRALAGMVAGLPAPQEVADVAVFFGDGVALEVFVRSVRASL
jgi:hypothetical protein